MPSAQQPEGDVEAEPPATEGSPQQPPSVSRAGTVVQILSGAVGLGAYVALAGGVAEWGRMTGAGLAASHALSALEPATLLASGFQTLLLIPVMLVLGYVAVRLEEDVGRAREKPRAAVVARRGWELGIELTIVAFAFVPAILAAYLVLALMIHANDVPLLVFAIAAVAVALPPSMLYVFIVRAAGNRAARRRVLALMRRPPSPMSPVPNDARIPVAWLTRAPRVALTLVTLSVAASVAVLAGASFDDGLHVGPVHLEHIPNGVALAASRSSCSSCSSRCSR